MPSTVMVVRRRFKAILGKDPIGLAQRPTREFLVTLGLFMFLLVMWSAISWVFYGRCSDTWYTICDPFSTPNQSMSFESCADSSSRSTLSRIRNQHLIFVRRMSYLRALHIFVRKILNDKPGRTRIAMLPEPSSVSPDLGSGYGYNSNSELVVVRTGFIVTNEVWTYQTIAQLVRENGSILQFSRLPVCLKKKDES